MMEKFKSLSKGKKAGVFAIGLAILVVLGVITGSLMGAKDKTFVLSKENLTGLVDKAYTVETLNESKDNKKLEVAIKGDLAKADLEGLAKSLHEKATVSGWGKEQITINVFANDSKTIEKTDFYTEGLVNRIVLNIEKSEADISSYTTVPAVEKTDVLVENTKGDLTANDGNLVLSLDMNLSTDDDKMVDVAQQAKTFSILFRETNSDKEIKSMELRINPNNDERKYNFNTNFENVLEVIDVIHL